MRKYEIMYIIRTDIEEERVQSTIEKFQNIITQWWRNYEEQCNG